MMTVSIVPPFKLFLRISERAGGNPEELSLRRLRDVVIGKDASFPRSQAIALLQLSDFPNKHRDFETVLENEREPSGIRYLAAINLGKINSPAATDILIRNSGVRDERVLTGVMKALGRIGGESALDAVLRARDHATGLAASQATFAAALISYRQGLEGSDLPVPARKSYLDPSGSCMRPLSISRADSSDAELCLRALARQPFGVEFAEQLMFQVRCEQRTLMILFSRDFIGSDAVRKLCERKTFSCVVASRSEETKSYSAAFLLLTSPANRSGKVDLLVHRPTGELIFGGTAFVRNDRLEFAIRSVPRPGAFAVQIEGVFEGGRLELKTAQYAPFVQQRKRQPIEMPWPMSLGRPES